MVKMTFTRTATLCLLLALLSVETSFSVKTANLCSTSGLCCQRRDSGCVAQRIYPNHSAVDTTQLPCYCDQACIRLQDCCQDYRQFCGVKDCVVSEWGPWSPCSASNDEKECDEIYGTEERHRVVLSPAVNGGDKCPHLTQSRQCTGTCTQAAARRQAVNMTLQSVPIKSSAAAKEDAVKLERRDEVIMGAAPEGCMELVIVKASKGCRRHKEQRLHTGSRICLQCLYTGGDGSCTHLFRSQTPTRKFRLSPDCHGKVTYLSSAPTNGSCTNLRYCRRSFIFHIQK